MSEWISKDIGAVSAWAVAKKNGWTGTEAEWEALQAAAPQYAQQAATAKTDAQTAKTAAEAAKTAAQAAQSAAETAAARDTAEWLNEHITNPDSPPLDRTLLSSSAAAPADMVGDLKTEIFKPEGVYKSWIQGTHNGSTGAYQESSTRCTLSKTFVLHEFDSISIRNIGAGLSAALAGAKNGVNVFDSLWQTSNYTYIVPSDADGATFIINVKNSADNLSPSGINSEMEVAVKYSTRPYLTSGRLTSAHNINNVIDAGTYRVSRDNTGSWKPANWPADGGGILAVMRGYGNIGPFGASQIVYLADRILIRFGGDSSWTVWETFYTEGSSPIVNSLIANAYQKKEMLTGANDIDSILDFGFYRAFANSLPAHWPASGGGSMLVIVAHDAGTSPFGRCQVIWLANKTLVRFGTDNGWTDWNYYMISGTGSADIIAFNNEEETTAKLRQLSTCYSIESTLPIQPLTILHFSDVHQNVTALNNVLKFKNHYSAYIDECLHTGDGVNNSTDTSVFGTVSGAGAILNAIGNHETWNISDWYALSESAAYNKYFAPFVSSWDVTITSGKCYYYKDYDAKHVRLIVLDCMHETADQLSWFANTALAGAKTKGYHVLIANHVIMGRLQDMNYLDSGFDNPAYPRATTPSYPFPMYASSGYIEAVDAFVAGGGVVVAWIAGHMHNDTLATYHNVLNIAVTTAGAYDGVGLTTDARAAGTRSADAFNVMGIDTVRGYLYMMRVGMNYNAVMKHVDTLCWDYINHRIIYTS